MSNPNIPKFKSVEAMILFFNGMYKLPIASSPSLAAETEWQSKRLGLTLTDIEALQQRMTDFFGTILQNELNEHKDILENIEGNLYNTKLDLLTDLADLLGDLIVYCMSEMARFGIPIDETLKIIMASNFSKLGEDGQPIYDENGKVCKGPGYWKPEPKILDMLTLLESEQIFKRKHT